MINPCNPNAGEVGLLGSQGDQPILLSKSNTKEKYCIKEKVKGGCLLKNAT